MSAPLHTSLFDEVSSKPPTPVVASSSPRPTAAPNRAQLPFALAIFLSAFLLFQIQLILGKQILPLFGGAPAVWTACLLFFQLALLAGYSYSHAVAAWLSPRQQSVAQISFLAVSLLVLSLLTRVWVTPVTPGSAWGASAGIDPTFAIIKFLAAAIGLPFFLLSTTSPLLQHWFSRVAPNRSPYRLYALSNAGSLLGLLSYPFLIEPHVRLHLQSWIWVTGFAVYAVAYAGCAYIASKGSASISSRDTNDKLIPRIAKLSLGWALPLRWISLAATASTLLLANTNLICQEVAVIPFLWVLPLSLYLLSFILCFDGDRWYRRGLFQTLFVIAAGLVILVSLPNTNYSYVVQLLAYSILLFAGCMVCHGEAARSRPGADSLTAFYLCISIGGALGGIFVSFLAPRIFPGYWEFPIAVLACIVLLLNISIRNRSCWWYTGRISVALVLCAGIILLAPATLAPVSKAAAHLRIELIVTLAGSCLLAALAFYLLERRKPAAISNPVWVRAAARIGLALLTAGLAISQKAEFYDVIARSRNFYGVLSVIENKQEHYLALRHGKTTHGFQYQDAQLALLATGYYGPHSGANAVISNATTRPLRVGLVGMGVGTLAALAQPGDLFRFYEINPDVYKWSSGVHPYFTYLQNSHGTIEVSIGDGRLSLEEEAAHGVRQNFDLLVLDAFSSDAIPMHLLTREAFTTYLFHMKSPHSVIAVHISNNTLDLRPVLAGVAHEFGFQALDVTPYLPNGPLSQSEWILLSRDPSALNLPDLTKDSEPLAANTKPLLWTDDYCDLLRVLRPRP
jgi:hypothetical protein